MAVVGGDLTNLRSPGGIGLALMAVILFSVDHGHDRYICTGHWLALGVQDQDRPALDGLHDQPYRRALDQFRRTMGRDELLWSTAPVVHRRLISTTGVVTNRGQLGGWFLSVALVAPQGIQLDRLR